MEIPKILLNKGQTPFSEAAVLKKIAQAETEFKNGKAKAFRSIKELLASNHGR